jgi:xanthine dehydrogenase accessory factor
MLGSRRRGDAILRMLREEGVPEASLARIRVPIGLDLGAKTAPEIALAILAEIVAARYGGTGRPLVLAKPARTETRDAAAAPPAEGAGVAPDARA